MRDDRQSLPPRRRHRPVRSARRGATLIDVATGSMLLSLLLIPSVHLIGESQSMHRRLTNRETILFEARDLMEQAKVALAEPFAFNFVRFRPVDLRRNIPVSDGPDLTSRIRAAADRSLPSARLVTVTVDVWYDANRNRRIDPHEVAETLRTQCAAP